MEKNPQIFNCREQQENPVWAHLSSSQQSRTDRKHESSCTSAQLCQTYLHLRHSAEFVSCSPILPVSQWAKRPKPVISTWCSPHSWSEGPSLAGETSLTLFGILVIVYSSLLGAKGLLLCCGPPLNSGHSTHFNNISFWGIFLALCLFTLFMLPYHFSFYSHTPFSDPLLSKMLHRDAEQLGAGLSIYLNTSNSLSWKIVNLQFYLKMWSPCSLKPCSETAE